MKKNQVVDVYRRVKNSLHLGVRHGCIYQKEGKNWKKIPELELPIRIRGLFDAAENESISTNDVKEVIERIAQAPELQLQFTDETEERYVNVSNGIFDADTGKMIIDENLKFSYVLNFNYVSSEKGKHHAWISFCKLLFRMLGEKEGNYCVRFWAITYQIIL